MRSTRSEGAPETSLPAVAAADVPSAVRNALVEEPHSRIAVGDSPAESPAPSAAARQPVDLVEKGLSGYAVKA
ncbi:hypothetical protein ABZ904_25540 [Streptomyces sp. NPDC046900]|uniref:hypothetical protein n=1 Tax=Streptomyces sp. NPDC046900 TaxID=3155473 RepID=UPI0033D1060F